MLAKCDIRLRDHRPRARKLTYGMDKTGRVEYIFNSLGFRGEDYDPKAKKTIFVSGCSRTFGTGLDIQDTWSYRFKEAVAEKYALDPAEVNLMNFSVGGCSTDYTVRVLLDQASRVKPDLLIAYFTISPRKEYLRKRSIHNIVPTTIDDKSPDFYKAYYDYITEEQALVESVKNLLLLQNFCESKHINYVMCFWDIIKLKKNRNKVLTFYRELINKERLADFIIEKLDFSADGRHPGIKANRVFAGKMLALCEKYSFL